MRSCSRRTGSTDDACHIPSLRTSAAERIGGRRCWGPAGALEEAGPAPRIQMASHQNDGRPTIEPITPRLATMPSARQQAPHDV